MTQMLSVEEARGLVLSSVSAAATETVDVLDAIGRVAATDLTSDIDVSPFAHSAMDGFALFAEDIAEASPDNPVVLDVIADEAAGDLFQGEVNHGQCVRIMTGAPLPDPLNAVVKYEIVGVESGDGKTGSKVSFTAPAKLRNNIREAGEEARAGETIVRTGDVISAAGIGFLASCGVMKVTTYARPRVAIIAIGSELVEPTEVPNPGKIRNSNSYALAACVVQAGAQPFILPIVEDTQEALSAAVADAAANYDFVITSGGASDGDYDFIKPVVEQLGELRMTLVNMRPGKAQTFGLVEGTPVFGLPGNPAAAYCGFQMIIRPALRKMQGYTRFEHTQVRARLATDYRKKDARRIYLRSIIEKDEQGYVVTFAKNQSSGLFGPLQRSNCLAIMPEGTDDRAAGDLIDCVMLDIPEELVL